MRRSKPKRRPSTEIDMQRATSLAFWIMGTEEHERERALAMTLMLMVARPTESDVGEWTPAAYVIAELRRSLLDVVAEATSEPARMVAASGAILGCWISREDNSRDAFGDLVRSAVLMEHASRGSHEANTLWWATVSTLALGVQMLIPNGSSWGLLRHGEAHRTITIPRGRMTDEDSHLVHGCVRDALGMRAYHRSGRVPEKIAVATLDLPVEIAPDSRAESLFVAIARGLDRANPRPGEEVVHWAVSTFTPRKGDAPDAKQSPQAMLDRVAAWVESRDGVFTYKDVLIAYHGREVTVDNPEKFAGRVISELRSRRGLKIDSMRDIRGRGDPAPASKGWMFVGRTPAT